MLQGQQGSILHYLNIVMLKAAAGTREAVADTPNLSKAIISDKTAAQLLQKGLSWLSRWPVMAEYPLEARKTCSNYAYAQSAVARYITLYILNRILKAPSIPFRWERRLSLLNAAAYTSSTFLASENPLE